MDTSHGGTLTANQPVSSVPSPALSSLIQSTTSQSLHGPNFSLFAPFGFAFVEEKLCRAFVPLLPSMHRFLDMANVGCIINVSGETLDDRTIAFLAESNISLINLFPDGSSSIDPFSSSVALANQWVTASLECVLAQSFSSTVLLLGSSQTCCDCVLVACLRRLQRICFTHIVSEFRMFAGFTKKFDLEQFIESYDPSLLLEAVSRPPEFLQVHFNLLKEEMQLLRRQRQVFMTSSTTSSKEPQASAEMLLAVSPDAAAASASADDIVFRLFFSDPQFLCSAELAYDASLSLVFDKEDDD